MAGDALNRHIVMAAMMIDTFLAAIEGTVVRPTCSIVAMVQKKTGTHGQCNRCPVKYIILLKSRMILSLFSNFSPYIHFALKEIKLFLAVYIFKKRFL